MSDERALKALTRLRHIETDEARRALAETLAEETALLDRDATLAAAAIAARTVAGEYDRDSFAAFLARVRTERETLAAALRATEARTAAARMALGSRRMAETTAAEALDRTVLERKAETARRDQLTLEDVARALRRR